MIEINGRELHGLEAWFWGFIALAITGVTLLVVAILLLVAVVVLLAPIWIPILIINHERWFK